MSLTPFDLSALKLERLATLAEFGVTNAESALFSHISYGLTRPSEVLPEFVGNDYQWGDPVAVGECRDALTACFARGWLQVIDEPILASIAADLRENQILGPIYGFPCVGGVDFTPAGTERWQRTCARLQERLRTLRPQESAGFSAYPNLVHDKTAHFYQSRSAALAAVAKAREWDDVVSIEGPTSIGPWRAEWWRRFPEGYRVDIECRREFQGSYAGGEQAFMPYPTKARGDETRLRHALDRHNLTPAEWLMLAGTDHCPSRSIDYLPKWTGECVADLLGAAASEAECRMALDDCIRNGWLRVTDQRTLDEVRSLLAEDPTLLPVRSKVFGEQGDIDFTATGAALYRMVASEWLGADWEDVLIVERQEYVEEHQYCETEEGLRYEMTVRPVAGMVVRATRVIPIGPWCVYWWKRFPSGFRMERELVAS